MRTSMFGTLRGSSAYQPITLLFKNQTNALRATDTATLQDLQTTKPKARKFHKFHLYSLPKLPDGQINSRQEEDYNDIYHTSSNDNEVTLSIEDRRFVDIMEKGIHKNEFGNWQLPLPFRSPNIILPNNREQAVRRLRNLLRVFARKPNMKKDYFEFMGKLLKRNHATPLPESRAIRGQDHDDIKRRNVWYLPHFGVYHPRKPNSIRVVFDSSSEYQGTSLNKELLSGP